MSVKSSTVFKREQPVAICSGFEVLPINHSLTSPFLISTLIAVIMALASFVGLIYRESIYPTAALQTAFLASDGFNIVFGLPFLLLCLWMTRRGMLVGLLCWPGALVYVLYMYIPYLLSVPFNWLFLPYLLLVMLSAYTLAGLLAKVDGKSVQKILSGRVPVKTTAGILIGLGVLIAIRQTARIFAAQTGGLPVDPLELSAWIADFVVVVPMLLVVGIQLGLRKTLGYVAAAGLLAGYGILALSVIPYLLFSAIRSAVPFDITGLVIVLAMAGLCCAPLAFFIRGAVFTSPRQSRS